MIIVHILLIAAYTSGAVLTGYHLRDLIDQHKPRRKPSRSDIRLEVRKEFHRLRQNAQKRHRTQPNQNGTSAPYFEEAPQQLTRSL